MVHNFRWFIVGKLAGSAKPVDRADVNWLYQKGIRAVISLEPTCREVTQAMKDLEIEQKVLEIIEDANHQFLRPAEEFIQKAVGFIKACLLTDKPVLIHCHTGIGRTDFMHDQIVPHLTLP